jgi:hypothetical protein
MGIFNRFDIGEVKDMFYILKDLTEALEYS